MSVRDIGWRRLLVALGLVLGAALSAGAQSPIEEPFTNGFKSGRSYFSPEPWESYDPVSGNVLLTFTDLVLPGNAGRALSIQRTFNNQVSGDAAQVSRWTFGFPGIVMRVIEKPVPPNWAFEDDPFNITYTTPTFVMGDGSTRPTMYISRPAAATAATAEVVSTDFYRYDRQYHFIKMPDGTVCYYDPQTGRLTSFADPFGNTVQLVWTATSVTVTQSLGQGQVREVVMGLDVEGRVTSLMYGTLQWTYQYEHQMGSVLDITSVTLPNGSTWAFTYDSQDLRSVTTALGGQVDYEYVDYTLFVDPEDFSITEDRHSLRFRTSSGRGVAAGQWQIVWNTPAGWTFPINTTITTPSGAYVIYYNGLLLDQVAPNRLLTGNYGTKSKAVYAGPGGARLELEETTFQLVNSVSYAGPTAVFSTLEPLTRTINRDGRNYTTTYAYGTSNFGDYHRPQTVTEVGHLTRTTQRTYSHNTTKWILGMLTQEDVTIGSETVRHVRQYDQPTGFMLLDRLPYRVGSTDPYISTSFSPDAFGNVGARRTSTQSQWVYFSYDWGAVSAVQTPAHTNLRVINPDGTVQSETIGGRTTAYAYDPLFRVTSVQPPVGNATTTVYDDAAGTSTTTRGSFVVTQTVDGFGRRLSTSDNLGVSTAIEYDPQGRVIHTTPPYGNGVAAAWTTLTYDGLDRLRSQTNPDATAIQWSFGDGVVSVIDENSHTTLQRFQAFGHPDEARHSGVTDALGSVWDYEYDVWGHRTKVTAPGAVVRTWSYNGNGLLKQETQPESGTSTYAYDANFPHLLKQKVDARGTVLTYSYDSSERLTGIVGGGRGSYFTYEFGSDNRQSASTDDIHSVFFYDAGGRPLGRDDVIDGRTYQTRYEFDNDDNVISISYPMLGTERRRVTYQYDSASRITSVLEPGANRTYASGFTYHPSGALTSFTAGNATQTTIVYDANRPWVRSISSGPLQLTYPQYDNAGNPLQITDSRPEIGTQTFSFDVLNRLSGAAGPYGTLTYPYDAHGNRTTAPAGPTIAYESGTMRLTQQGIETYTYDAAGNLLTAPNRAYTYTPRNMLETATVSAVQTRFAYDGDELRFSSLSPDGATLFFRGLGGELLTEWKNPGPAGETRDYIYAAGRLLAAVKRSAVTSDPPLCGPLGALGTITVPANGVGQVPFCGSAGQLVSVAVRLVSGDFSSTWNVRVKSPSGVQVGVAWVQSSGYIFRDTLTLPNESGTYNIEIDPTGSLSGTVEVAAYDVRHLSGTIAPNGPPVTVGIGTPGQNAQLTFAGTAGQTISASMQLASAATYAGTWYMRIKGPTGATLQSTWVSNGTWMFSDALTLATSGTYTVEVDPTGMELGSVALSLFSMSHVEGPIPTNGTAVTVPLLTPGQVGRLTFAAAAGQLVSTQVSLTSAPSWGGLWYVRIKKPDGSQLSYTTASSGSSVFLDTVTIPTTGTYTLEIDPVDMLTATVEARLYTVTHASGSVSVNGASQALSLTTPGQNATVTFTGTASQVVRVRLTNNSVPGSTTVSLKRPDGSTMTSKTSSAASFDLTAQTLATSGTYSIVVDPSSANVGGISVAVVSP